MRSFGLTQINAGLSSRTAKTGNQPPSGSRGVTQYHADNVIPLPSGSILRPVPPLELPNVLQTPIDVGVALFWLAYFLLYISALIWLGRLLFKLIF